MVDIHVTANTLRSGVTVVQYRAGRVFGAVMFDKNGRYEDATCRTVSSKGRGFCEIEDLPAGVLDAARKALSSAAVTTTS